MTLTILEGLFKILGSLGLFLYGMKVMSDGIQKTAGEGLQKILNLVTGNRFMAIFTGFAITCLIQSSSATTVMVVSFVNAGLLSLAQAIGVIMGANVGTTITGWIVALLGFKFSVAAIALPAIGVGLPLMFTKKHRWAEFGETIVGFGLLFMGLDFLKHSVPDIKNNTEVLQFLANFTDMPGVLLFFIFAAVGTILTIAVQSSSAVMAITLTMAHNGWIDYPSAAAIVIGSNVGTTVTAWLASIGANVNAKRAARAHLLFNILGTLWVALLFSPFLRLVDYIVPGSPTDPTDITAHLAMFHTMFNIINTVVFVGFIDQLALLVKKLVPEPEEELPSVYELKYISTALQDTPELNLLRAKHEISEMANLTNDMFIRFLAVFRNSNKEMTQEVKDLKRMEDYTDQMQEQISQFLVACSQENVNDTSRNNINAMMRIVNELESIGDCCFKLIVLAQKRYNKGIPLPEEALTDLWPAIAKVEEFLTFISEHLNEHLSREKMNTAVELEKNINSERDLLKRKSRSRIQGGGDVKGELLYLDIVKNIEHVGDYALNIAQSLRVIR